MLKVTLFFLSLLGSKLGSQTVSISIPSWPSCCCWIKLPKLNPIVIVLWPKFPKLRFASCWSKLRELDSTPRVGLKLPKLTSSRSGSDSGLSLSRSKLFKPDSRLLLLLLSLLLSLLLVWLLLLWCCWWCCCYRCCCCCFVCSHLLQTLSLRLVEARLLMV